jgi:pimeloyl-ACP methyl ester carboxylesterase
MMKSKTIIFIHGMFMTSLCWENWLPYFKTRGYTVSAPNWPGRDRPVPALRSSHPDPQLGKLTLTDVVEHHAGLIQKMDEKPIVIGHSMGGLVTQLLVQRNLAAAGVAIHSAPPAGVFNLSWSFLRANWPMINPLVSSSEPRRMSLEDFQYAFVNGLPPEEQRVDYERYVVPESRRVPRQSLTGAGRIDFSKPHAPLLLIAGTADHIIPAGLNRANFQKYGASPSPTDLKEFPGRVHFTLGQKHWENVADAIEEWLNSL